MGTCFQSSRASNVEVNRQIWSEFQLIRDLIPVLVFCKFDENSTKNKCAIALTYFSGAHGRLSQKLMSGGIWPKFEFVHFISVLVTCKFDQGPIRNEGAIDSKTFCPLYAYVFFFSYQ